VLADEKGVSLRVSAAAPDIAIDCHPPSLRRVICNLLDNAIRYTREGGRIEILVRPAEESVEVSVLDDGEGIPASEIENVFDRFYRGTSSRGGKTTGFGLGLSIAKRIVSEHGGSVDIESQQGSGTTVRISLPLPDGEVT
jgi:signal transduction histidine kinase